MPTGNSLRIASVQDALKYSPAHSRVRVNNSLTLSTHTVTGKNSTILVTLYLKDSIIAVYTNNSIDIFPGKKRRSEVFRVMNSLLDGLATFHKNSSGWFITTTLSNPPISIKDALVISISQTGEVTIMH